MPRRFNLSGNQATVTSALKSVVAVIGTAAIRPTIYDFTLGTSATPADHAWQWQVLRVTTVGTSTLASPLALDSQDGSPTATGGKNYSVEGTPSSIIFGTIDLNMRATYRWVAAPGGEMIGPASTNSMNIACLNVTAASGAAEAAMNYWE